jgi:hypothetical protein
MEKKYKTISLEKIIALWAFTEAFLGGFLHIIKIPFTGLIIGSFALLYISLISYSNYRKGQIIQAAIIVIIIKMLLSPYTPIMAYFAVFYQGLLGELFFSRGSFRSINCFFLGILFAILSSVQKVLTLTLIFGMTLWESIDSFLNYAVNELSFSNLTGIKFSYFIVCLYFMIHLSIGIISSIFVIRFIKNLTLNLTEPEYKINIKFNGNVNNSFFEKKNKRFKLLKITFYIFLLVLLFITYFAPDKINLSTNSLLLMIIRGFIIILVWFKLLSPFIIRMFKKFISNKKSNYSKNIDNIVDMLPIFKLIAEESWHRSDNLKGFKKFIHFVKLNLINFLIYRKEPELKD